DSPRRPAVSCRTRGHLTLGAATISSPVMSSTVTVLGVGADGWTSLKTPTQQAILAAEVVLGGSRHLDMLPDQPGQQRVVWPVPLRENLPALLEKYDGSTVVVLASGDPLLSGIGSTL